MAVALACVAKPVRGSTVPVTQPDSGKLAAGVHKLRMTEKENS